MDESIKVITKYLEVYEAAVINLVYKAEQTSVH